MKKILIIEDDLIVASVYRNKLLLAGFEVETASSGRSGLQLTNSFHPDLIVLDLMLPDISGVEIMKDLRALPAFEKLPIIVFSNTYLSNVMKDAWKAGASKCFSKASCTPKQMIEAIRSLLGDSPTAATEPPAQPDKPAEVLIPMPKMAAATPPPAPDMGEQLRQEFPGILANLRAFHQLLVKAGDPTGRCQQLDAIYASVHALTGYASTATMISLAQVAEALEALVRELQQKPASLTPSTIRTVANTIDFLEYLFKRHKIADALKDKPAKILVVDDEALSRRAVTHALEKARLPSEDLDDPVAALKRLSENTYDLVILDAEMPAMNGFELCAKLRTLPAHKKTPVIFVTSLNDFEARANSTMAGANDFIVKPFLFIELAVKGLVYVLRSRMEAAKFNA